MDVFLVPVGASQDELYCEIADEPVVSGTRGRSTWWTRLVDRFSHALAEAEDDRRRRERGQIAESRGLWRTLLRWISEAVAEQRLLWHLRGATAARLVHADDVTSDRALEIAKRSMRSDRQKHLRWLVIDGLLLLISVPLTVIPGPNLPALYFAFRVVGHLLSYRGAQQGLTRVAWAVEPQPLLAELRRALALDADARTKRLEEIGAALGLDRLAAFVERVAEHPAAAIPGGILPRP